MMKKKYLLDSNICIHLLRQREEVIREVERVGWHNCCISALTVVELYYGAECSNNPKKNKAVVASFVDDVEVVPFEVCITEFCKQKARLRRLGTMIEDTDLYIGTTAVAMKYVLVTENIKHLSRVENLKLENWIVR